jgi:hypothetical protein
MSFYKIILHFVILIKDNTDIAMSASYLYLHLENDREGWPKTIPYDKRDDFNFSIVHFPFICSNIPEAHAYDVYISQLIFQCLRFLSRFP